MATDERGQPADANANSDVNSNADGRHGFLPIHTNLFDRVFISIVVLVAIHLIWLRFLEAFLPLILATILSILLGIWIVRKG